MKMKYIKHDLEIVFYDHALSLCSGSITTNKGMETEEGQGGQGGYDGGIGTGDEPPIPEDDGG